MKLYPHNQRAYENVMAHFADHHKAAVIQPTGTGKSYVIGAVAAHFQKVLVVAPNDYVLSQVSSEVPKADTATYSLLARRDEMPNGYDLICFDEFHRIGADTWRYGVDKVIDANPNAKILGTTATPERSLEKRNMADEFFEGDVVSHKTLTDAWVDGILRVPKYIIGVVSMTDTKADYTNRINSAKRINDTQKKEATALLDNIVRDWSYSYGVPQILKKHIDGDVKRMIVFAQTINKLDEVVGSIRPWFNEAGLKLANVYAVHSKMGSEAMRQMRDFENDESDGIKVLVSVDMLNEGIHVDRVDAVMLLRSTISKNLYMQQIGRCFSVGQKHQPIILDLADNLTSACGYEGIYSAQQRYIGRLSSEVSNRNPDEFVIFDSLKETRELIAQIDKQIAFRWTYEDCQREALKYESRIAFANGSKNAYQSARAHGWLDDICSHMVSDTKPFRYWHNFENCKAEALKYKTKTEFHQNAPQAYNQCLLHDWMDIVCTHMTSTQVRKGYWSKERCIQEALKYQYRVEFNKFCKSAYVTACKNGWLEECCSHMKKYKFEHDWTIDELESYASKCKSKTEWREKGGAFTTSYKIASEMGVLNEICDRLGLRRRQ